MMRQFQSNSYLFGGNAPYVEDLYERYLDNPGSVPEKWRAYFDQMQLVPAADGSPSSRDVAHAPIVESFAQRAKSGAFQQKVEPLAPFRDFESDPGDPERHAGGGGADGTGRIAIHHHDLPDLEPSPGGGSEKLPHGVAAPRRAAEYHHHGHAHGRDCGARRDRG